MATFLIIPGIATIITTTTAATIGFNSTAAVVAIRELEVLSFGL
jgi:hypothetical protein